MTEPLHPLSVGELDDSADIVSSLLAANRVFVAIASRALVGLQPEITIPQWRALVLVDLNGSMTMGELAAALGVVPSTATRMCDRLVTKNLLARTVDPANRRRVSVTLQPAGEHLVRAAAERRRTDITNLLNTIPAREQAELGSALRILVKAANQYSDDVKF